MTEPISFPLVGQHEDELAKFLRARYAEELVPISQNCRALLEVEAKRKLIDLHAAEEGQHPDFCWHDKHELPCPTLRLLALPYSGHPDYDESWKP